MTENEQPKAARLHVFVDGVGWSENREENNYDRLELVPDARELPLVASDFKLTVFICSSVEDVEQLREVLAELSMELSRQQQEGNTWNDSMRKESR